MQPLPDKELLELRTARDLLEKTSLTGRLSETLGKPVDKGMAMLPNGWQNKIAEATKAALLKGLEVSIHTMGENEPRRSNDLFHRLLTTASGAVGGAFGILALPVELPFSTCLILRSVAEIARSEGHDISQLEVRLSCLEVFALGSHGHHDGADASGYWATRDTISVAMQNAAAYIARTGIVDASAAPVSQFILSISSRFGVIVGEQAALQSLPVVGALGGGTLNYIFLTHFQHVARAHFTIKRLEKEHGTSPVRAAYLAMQD